ncbi:imelysin family protein [Ruegeria sp. 2205SS24-7]|uniref:imelysin family protein n=1 Tax=Ruegeria discodermiae TaxID=3064389 RepID=UPI002740E229|nr:imelysin family protein [Ruegeria sp. 2205SS24-7]MDP5217251.1 imelysin family protein [Ruegeria sp. 2205SS24-7]
MIRVFALCLMFFPGAALAQSPLVQQVVDSHVLPGFQTLAQRTEALKAASVEACTGLEAPYHDAFDAWMAVSHLRFGPTETQDRAFAMAFWPDTKGFTPKALSALIADQDPAVKNPAQFSEVSIAARGLFALEFLLYDAQLSTAGEDGYRCDLIRAIAEDMDRIAVDILSDWAPHYAALLTAPGPDSRYRSDEEAAQELFKALTTGLQFTSDTRLGRPMGSFDKPRPNRAEARRSERSLRNVILSLAALRELAALLSQGHPGTAAELDAAFDRSIALAERLEDPVFAGVATPQGRFRVEALRNSIDEIRAIAATRLGPQLGVAAGFNSLDGD